MTWKVTLPTLALPLLLWGCAANSQTTTEPSGAVEPTTAPAAPTAAVEAPAAPSAQPTATAADTASEGEGFLRIAWRLQSQENVYGFNVYRAETPETPDSEYEIVNDSIIPGHGSTALPQNYFFMDSGLEIGKRYYYYVTEVTTDGSETPIEGARGGAAAKPRSHYVERGQLDPE